MKKDIVHIIFMLLFVTIFTACNSTSDATEIYSDDLTMLY